MLMVFVMYHTNEYEMRNCKFGRGLAPCLILSFTAKLQTGELVKSVLRAAFEHFGIKRLQASGV
jgi:hypothetical protein